MSGLDLWAILVVISILSVSGLFTLWQTRTYRRQPRLDWRAELQKSWGTEDSDAEAIGTWTEEHENMWRSNQPATLESEGR